MTIKSGSDDAPNSNSYFLDPEDAAEMGRLINLDRITTQAMGGPLSGLSEEEIAGLRNVLDLACGPGGWVLDVAFSLPEVEVAGIDVSHIMINYANARARVQELTNASFGVMDITQPLDFAGGAFDLVNARFLVGVLRREAWPALIAEATRILRPGGILRLTEAIDGGVTTSPAFERGSALTARAFWRAGYGFSPAGYTLDMTPVLPRLLRQAGYQHIQIKAHALDFSGGTPAWADMFRNYEVAGSLGKAFIVRTGVATPEETEQLYQQALNEFQAPDFCGMWHYVTVWGARPA